MEATGFYLLIRVLSCGIWTFGGIHEILHYKGSAARMTEHHIPASRYLLTLVIIMKLVGSLLLITNYYVWAVALIWILFTIPATLLYHSQFYDAQGHFDQHQLTAVGKNISLIGGLLALIMLDPTKPQWLVSLIHLI